MDSRIPLSRDLTSFHQEVNEIAAYSLYLNTELKKWKSKLIEKCFATQQHRCMTSLRSGYYLKMTSENVKSFSQLPFIKPGGFLVANRLFEINEVSSIRSLIGDFLKHLLNRIPKMPDYLATLKSNSFNTKFDFLPENVSAKDFFACSSLPAVFGHYWTSDLREQYIEFLAKIAKKMPSSAFDQFREHWLYDCITNFIRASNIRQFLQRSFGDIILEILRDKSLHQFSLQSNTQPAMNKLIPYAQLMLEKMTEYLPIFPNDVRHLLSKFGSREVEIVFLDCVLAPAITNPKGYGIVPPTFAFDNSPLGPARSLQLLAQLFRYILHPESAKKRNIDATEISTLPLSKLLNLIQDWPGYDNGFTLADILPIGEIYSISILISLPDVLLWANLITKMTINDTVLANAASKLVSETTFTVPFLFFHYDLWDFNSLGLKVPKINVKEVEKGAPLAVSAASNILFQCLTKTCSSHNADSVQDYITSLLARSKLEHNSAEGTYFKHFENLFKELSSEEKQALLPSLEDEIRRQQKQMDWIVTQLTAIDNMLNRLDENIKMYEESEKEEMAILYSNLVSAFLKKESGCAQTLLERKEDMLLRRSVFTDFLLEYLRKLNKFVTEYADYAVVGAARHFHSWVTQQMPLSEFESLHRNYSRCDKLITELAKQSIESACIFPAPAKIRKLFQYPSLFTFSTAAFSRATFLEIPLEAIDQVDISIDLLSQMYDLEVGGIPQADELTPLFNYVLLTAPITNLFSVGKYLEHFLLDIPTTEIDFVTESERIALTHLVIHVTSLEEILNEF